MPPFGPANAAVALAGAARASPITAAANHHPCILVRRAMAKKVLTMIKLQIPAGAANPAPPVGPALGQHGVNIMEFCKAFNARTQQDAGTIIPVEITVYEDRSFDFITKTRSEEHTSELQSRLHLVSRLLLEKKNNHTHI